MPPKNNRSAGAFRMAFITSCGVALAFAVSVGMLRPVLTLLAGDDTVERREIGLRDAVGVVVTALFPRLPQRAEPEERH